MFNSHWFELFENTPNLSGQLLQDISAKIFWSQKQHFWYLDFFDILGVILTGRPWHDLALISIYRLYIDTSVNIYIIWTLDIHPDTEYIGATLYIGGGTIIISTDFWHSAGQTTVCIGLFDICAASENAHFNIVLFNSLVCLLWPLWQNAHLAKMHICTYYTKMLIIK